MYYYTSIVVLQESVCHQSYLFNPFEQLIQINSSAIGSLSWDLYNIGTSSYIHFQPNVPDRL